MVMCQNCGTQLPVTAHHEGIDYGKKQNRPFAHLLVDPEHKCKSTEKFEKEKRSTLYTKAK